MKILLVHNYYQQPGGEDRIFEAEGNLLEENGHVVIQYKVHNNQVKGFHSAKLLKSTLWNSQSYKNIQALIARERPQIAHFHNTFPLISPSGYYAAKSECTPIIQTLHNFRLLCPSAILFRDGHVCEDCVGKLAPWPGVKNRCYRDSFAASAAVGLMNGMHNAVGTWISKIDIFISLSEFAKQMFIKGGIPSKKIIVKPNFTSPGFNEEKKKIFYALFVGRLTREKGIGILLEAWKVLGKRIPLKIVGDGPLSTQIDTATKQYNGIHWVGRKTQQEVNDLMRDATCLIFPSLWYEPFGLVAIEAFAMGTPVIGSKIGALAEIIADGNTGLHFEPGNSQDLISKVNWACDNPAAISQMGHEARKSFERYYSPEKNYEMLLNIYQQAISSPNAN